MEQYWSIYDYSTYSIRGGSQLEGTTGLGYDYGLWCGRKAGLSYSPFPSPTFLVEVSCIGTQTP